MGEIISTPEQKFPILKFFEYKHLPDRLQAISKPFHDLAYVSVNDIVKNPAEMAAGLRKLLEAKDCIVRSFL
jgi:hypothetical protein